MLLALDNIKETDFKYKVGILITLASGLRLGELMRLNWKSIDYEKAIISISQANQYLPELGTFTKETKNETSNRKIILPQEVMSLLKYFEVYQDNLKEITFHQFRHTMASVLLQEGIPVGEVSDRLGHSNPTTTWNIYAHVLKLADKRAYDTMAKVMFKKNKIIKDNE